MPKRPSLLSPAASLADMLPRDDSGDPVGAVAAGSPAKRRHCPPGSIAETVLSATRVRASGRGVVAATVVALFAHGLGAAAALRIDRAPPQRMARKPAMSIEQVRHIVDLSPPEPEPLPEPEVAPPPPPKPARHLRRVASRTPAPAEPAAPPPPPAQAAEVVTAEAPAEPLDFTGFDMVTGKGPRFVGGVTARAGSNTEPVRTATVDLDGKPGGAQGEASLARPVTLPARNWRCPWPREADALNIDEQVVVLRVAVAADGRVTSADVTSDPGYGFGKAAQACAHEVRFLPARDSHGNDHAATSPPIRVTFTR